MSRGHLSGNGGGENGIALGTIEKGDRLAALRRGLSAQRCVIPVKLPLLLSAVALVVACGPADSSREVSDAPPESPPEVVQPEVEALRSEIEPLEETPAAPLAVAETPSDLTTEPGSFPWRRGWYTDGRSDWYTVRDDGRVLMSTATVTVDPDSTIRGLVFELDVSDPAAARSRPYASDQRWTDFVLTFEGDSTFLIDGTPFTYVEVDLGDDFDVRTDTPADRWGLYFLLDQLDANGESMPE
jgi:hypothetical protein